MTVPSRRGRQPADDSAPLGSVTIGAREIYNAVVATSGKVDHLGYSADQTAKKVDNHEVRITSLEARRFPLNVTQTVLSLSTLAVAVAAYFHR